MDGKLRGLNRRSYEYMSFLHCRNCGKEGQVDMVLRTEDLLKWCAEGELGRKRSTTLQIWMVYTIRNDKAVFVP